MIADLDFWNKALIMMMTTKNPQTLDGLKMARAYLCKAQKYRDKFEGGGPDSFPFNEEIIIICLVTSVFS